MDYVEYARVRRALVIFTIVVASIAIVTIIGPHIVSSVAGGAGSWTKVRIYTKHSRSMGDALAHVGVPLALLLGIAGYGAIAFSTFLASSLNKENAFASFVFTKPVSRQRLALSHMAIDTLGIVSAFAIACVAIVSTSIASGWFDRITFDPSALWIVLLELGVAFMWYGILQAITASYRGKGGSLCGWSWALFGIAMTLNQATFLGPILGPLVRAFNFVNPLAYAPSIIDDHRGGAVVSTYMGASLGTPSAIAWAIACIACVLAIVLWKRVEA